MVDQYVATANEIYVANAVYFALVMALHFVLVGIVKSKYPAKDFPFINDTKKFITFIQGANAFITAFFVTALYAYGYYSLDGSRESRWHGNNAGLTHALCLHIGLTLYDNFHTSIRVYFHCANTHNLFLDLKVRYLALYHLLS